MKVVGSHGKNDIDVCQISGTAGDWQDDIWETHGLHLHLVFLTSHGSKSINNMLTSGRWTTKVNSKKFI